MRALIGLVVVMSVLIVAGVAVIGITIVHRLGAAAPALLTATNITLNEPAGTRIASATETGGRLTAVLQGGGPDRVVVIDLASGRTLAHVKLAE